MRIAPQLVLALAPNAGLLVLGAAPNRLLANEAAATVELLPAEWRAERILRNIRRRRQLALTLAVAATLVLSVLLR